MKVEVTSEAEKKRGWSGVLVTWRRKKRRASRTSSARAWATSSGTRCASTTAATRAARLCGGDHRHRPCSNCRRPCGRGRARCVATTRVVRVLPAHGRDHAYAPWPWPWTPLLPRRRLLRSVNRCRPGWSHDLGVTDTRVSVSRCTLFPTNWELRGARGVV